MASESRSFPRVMQRIESSGGAVFQNKCLKAKFDEQTPGGSLPSTQRSFLISEQHSNLTEESAVRVASSRGRGLKVMDVSCNLYSTHLHLLARLPCFTEPYAVYKSAVVAAKVTKKVVVVLGSCAAILNLSVHLKYQHRKVTTCRSPTRTRSPPSTTISRSEGGISAGGSGGGRADLGVKLVALSGVVIVEEVNVNKQLPAKMSSSSDDAEAVVALLLQYRKSQ
ncbi:hypothetical protein E2C01_003948 [Portunus trituberculatus]|uniref:Uncharacterized protein n=1 Tax=Portunus trituberculatus TaxID=210409 RepID=A0A5B7CSI0_PORTR|nr:hypothetical protein [Portunus trituberculatus]